MDTIRQKETERIGRVAVVRCLFVWFRSDTDLKREALLML
jgi:hypothetical protein